MTGSGDKFDYKFVPYWGQLPLWWNWGNVSDMATDSQGRIFVLDRGAHPIIVLDRDGKFITSWGEGQFSSGRHGLYIDRYDNVYVADCGYDQVYKFSLDGKLQRAWGTKDGPSATFYGEPFSSPTGVAFGPSGKMYVSDGYGNYKVQVFAPDGSFLTSWGKPGTGPGEFALVHSIDVGPDEKVYVCDRENRRIQIFDENGKYLTEWGGMNLPVDVRVKGDIVYVIEEGNDWSPEGTKYGPSGVSIFSSDGKLLSRWHEGERGTKGLFNIHGITVDHDDSIYATQIYDSRSTVPFSTGIFKFVREK
jgi:DNA-binding beta-propeller fold protein YncE